MTADNALPVTASAVLTIIHAIERHPDGSPLAAAYRSALRSMGVEADVTGGRAAVKDLFDAIANEDADLSDARSAIVCAAWADLLPAPAGG